MRGMNESGKSVPNESRQYWSAGINTYTVPKSPGVRRSLLDWETLQKRVDPHLSKNAFPKNRASTEDSDLRNCCRYSNYLNPRWDIGDFMLTEMLKTSSSFANRSPV